MDYIVDVLVRLKELARTLERLGLEDDSAMLHEVARDLMDARIRELRDAVA